MAARARRRAVTSSAGAPPVQTPRQNAAGAARHHNRSIRTPAKTARRASSTQRRSNSSGGDETAARTRARQNHRRARARQSRPWLQAAPIDTRRQRCATPDRAIQTIAIGARGDQGGAGYRASHRREGCGLKAGGARAAAHQSLNKARLIPNAAHQRAFRLRCQDLRNDYATVQSHALSRRSCRFEAAHRPRHRDQIAAQMPQPRQAQTRSSPQAGRGRYSGQQTSGQQAAAAVLRPRHQAPFLQGCADQSRTARQGAASVQRSAVAGLPRSD